MPKSGQRWVTSGVELDEGAGVEQQLDALARGQLAGVVLLGDALGAAAQPRGGQALAELGQAGVVVGRRLARACLFITTRPSGWDDRAWVCAPSHAPALSDNRSRCDRPACPSPSTPPRSRACLAAISEQADDLVDAFFERSEEVTLRTERRVAGLERLARGGPRGPSGARRPHLAGQPRRLSGRAFAEASRQVARVQPRAALPEPAIALEPWPEAAAPELAEFARAVERALRAQLVAFPVAAGAAPPPARAAGGGAAAGAGAASARSFWSAARRRCRGGAPARCSSSSDAAAAEAFAAIARRPLPRARGAGAGARGAARVVLGPGAAAVLLHEAVAHALEVDLLARSGQPAAALGVELGAACLDVLDDPGARSGGRAARDRRRGPAGVAALAAARGNRRAADFRRAVGRALRRFRPAPAGAPIGTWRRPRAPRIWSCWPEPPTAAACAPGGRPLPGRGRRAARWIPAAASSRSISRAAAG